MSRKPKQSMLQTLHALKGINEVADIADFDSQDMFAFITASLDNNTVYATMQDMVNAMGDARMLDEDRVIRCINYASAIFDTIDDINIGNRESVTTAVQVANFFAAFQVSCQDFNKVIYM